MRDLNAVLDAMAERDDRRRRRRWLMVQGGGVVLGLLTLPVAVFWLARPVMDALTMTFMWANVAIAFWGRAAFYRLGYQRGRLDRGMEFAAREGVGPPRVRAARSNPWDPDPQRWPIREATHGTEGDP